MNTGTVKFFSNQRGYGFISPDNGGNDVFVHVSALQRAGMSDLAEGQKVSYDTEQEYPQRKDCCEEHRRSLTGDIVRIDSLIN